MGALVLLFTWGAANWAYQAMRKPTELFFPVSGVLFKEPPETWRSYGTLFDEHSTAVITPELLAALAQVEAAGNPLARTYWRWRFARNPFEVYRPASSAVGMYQMTDATFEEARRYCIHDHRAVDEGCWFNALYSRVLPSHAIEMTSALLDRRVARAIERRPNASATLQRRQDLAAVIHLCGPAAGDAFVARGFRLAPGQRCGDHDAGAYLARINSLKRRFARMQAEGRAGGDGLALSGQVPGPVKPVPIVGSLRVGTGRTAAADAMTVTPPRVPARAQSLGVQRVVAPRASLARRLLDRRACDPPTTASLEGSTTT